MSLPPGLPPLPKSLSAAAPGIRDVDSSKPSTSSSLQPTVRSFDADGASAGASCSRSNSHSQGQRQGSLSSTQDSTSDRDSVHSRASSSLSAHDTPTSTATLDSQISILRREMYSLRQLDLSLLSQLWALNESIQGFRTFLQEREDLSPSPTPSNTNSISTDEEPDVESFSPLPQAPPLAAVVAGSGSSASQASTSTSASNSLSAALTGNHHRPHAIQPAPTSRPGSSRTHSQASSGGRAHSQQSVSRTHSQPSSGGRAHPQLPPILQQRMRRPPPPPPPARSGKSPNQAPEQKRPV